MDPFIAQIMMFGGNFAPRGWAFCHGQLLAISSHTALFSILGTMYGVMAVQRLPCQTCAADHPSALAMGPG